MSRPVPSLLRSVASSSRFVQARTLFDGPRPAQTMSGNTASVDPRVLQGLPHFLPQANMDRLCEWQGGLWSRLQGEVRNNPDLLEVQQKWDRSGLDMTYVVSQTAKDPNLTLAYNYAALLLNNSFFLENISADEPTEVPYHYRELGERIEAYAEGTTGGCWLWLARTGEGNSAVDIIPSFGSGTLLITHRAQRGREDIPVFGAPSSSGTSDATSTSPSDPSSESAESTDSTPAPRPTFNNTPQRRSGLSTAGYPAPLAVLNLFESAYLGEKYGVWDRKQYARDWWKSLDWNKIQKRSTTIV